MKMNNINNQWSKEWPNEEGFYWYWGEYKSLSGKPYKLNSVKVSKGGTSLFYVMNGAFAYKNEFVEDGLWIKAELPEWPFLEPRRFPND